MGEHSGMDLKKPCLHTTRMTWDVWGKLMTNTKIKKKRERERKSLVNSKRKDQNVKQRGWIS